MKPKVSVIIPTYNRAKFITEAIESVLSQNYPNMEVIVVDDGSTDNTKEVLEPFHDRIIYLYQQNSGPASARNLGLKNAKGELIAFNDSDDLWLPGSLSEKVEFLKNHLEVSMVFTDCYISTHGELEEKSLINRKIMKKIFTKIPKKKEERNWYLFDDNLFDYLAKKNIILIPTVITKKSCFTKLGYFDEELIIHEEYDMWMRVAKEGCKIGFIDKPYAIVRNHDENIHMEDSESKIISEIMHMQKYFRVYSDLSKKSKKIINRKIAIYYGRLCYFYFSEYRLNEVRAAFCEGLKFGITAKMVFYWLCTFIPKYWIKRLRVLKQYLTIKIQNVFSKENIRI